MNKGRLQVIQGTLFVASKLYVGRLPYAVNDAELQELFAAHGTVESARVITDRDSGQSKGFGFVEMSNDDEAAAAIQALNNHEIQGRQIAVSVARPMEKRPDRDFNRR
jgi:cold-inducible RNA-binding protein